MDRKIFTVDGIDKGASQITTEEEKLKSATTIASVLMLVPNLQYTEENEAMAVM